MLRRFLYVIFIVLTCVSITQAREPSLKYLVRVPTNKLKAKTPLLLFLHGYGSNEADLFSLASSFPDSFLIVSARAPYVLGDGSYCWYHLQFSGGDRIMDTAEAETSKKALHQFLSEIINKYGVDPGRVYLFGFSQGAIMSYSVALTTPGRVKAICAVGGRILPQIKLQSNMNKQLSKLSVFIGHGTKDEVVPFTHATDAQAWLKGKVAKLHLETYNSGHTIPGDVPRQFSAWINGLDQ